MKADIEFINNTFRILPAYKELKEQFCLANNGKIGSIEITGEKRRIEHNNYYWLLLGILSEHTGHTPAELHDHYCRRVLGEVVVKVNGKETKERERSSDKDTSNFNRLCEEVKTDFIGMGIVIPELDK